MKMWHFLMIAGLCHLVAVGTMLVQGCRTPAGTGAVHETEPARIPTEKTMPPLVGEAQEKVSPTPMPVGGPEVKTVSSSKAGAESKSIYVVASGDSLSVIAKRFHMREAELMALNNIKDANKIRVGQKLTIAGEIDATAVVPVPKKPASKPKAKSEPAPAPKAVAEGDSYVVQAGDSLSKIAVKFGTTVSAIQDANGLKSTKINSGKKLVIPAGAPKQQSLIVTETAAPAEKKSDSAAKIQPPKVSPAAPAPDVNLSAAPAGGKTTKATVEPVVAPKGDVKTDSAPPIVKKAATANHTVLEGEDLKQIAITYGVRVDTIKQANGLVDDKIQPGQTLKVPLSE